MADATTVVEGKVKYRDGKKWKSRWCVLKKPSPVADRLQLVLYKDVHEALRAGGKVKTSFPLDGYLGLESGFTLERESNVLAVICHKHVTLLAFDTREYLIQFEVKIRRSLGQEFQFPVQPVKVPSGSRIPLEGVNLLIHGTQFCITAQVPPRILQCWNVADLRRYGAVDGKFCFEGGSRCGKGAGVHAVQTDQADEISEILRVNSLGKSSAAAKAASNRSSQLLDYSLAAPDPFWTQNNQPGAPGAGAGAVGADRSAMLMCCQGLPGGGEGDEWGCRKRHSVSVTEFHRASATTFQEKLRLMSIENQERQRLMAIYDVPPKHSRKLEAASGPSCAEKSVEGVSAASSVSSLSSLGLVSTSGQLQPPKLLVRLDSPNSTSQAETGHSLAASQGRRVMVTSVAGREYCIPRSLNTTIFDSIVNAQVDTTKRNEALQTLQKQETDLHEEIILLDQLLQSCHPNAEREALNESFTDSMDPWQDRIATLEPPLGCSTPAHVAQKAASLPPKISSKTDPGLSAPPVRKPGTFPSASDHSVSALRESRTGAGSPLSPNLLSKLEKIPLDSHLNAPLPYVNLAKYDAETDSGCNHLHVGGDADSGCIAVPSRLLRNPAGGSLASLRNRSTVGAMPSRSFSETHIGPRAVIGQNSFAPQKPLPSPPKEESEGEFGSGSEGLSASTDMLLEDDVLLPPTTFAPPVPYPRPLTTMASKPAPVDAGSPPSTRAPLPPSANVLAPAVSVAIREPIYANEPPPPPPPRSKLDTPPPELPPKGPALLQRSKLHSSGSGPSISTTVPPVPPVRTRSLSVGSQGKFYDYDNQPGPNTPPVLPPEVSKGLVEDNYLPMGSPKSPPRKDHSQNGRDGDSSRPSSLYITGSPRPRGKGATPANRHGNADVLSGYMDMANMFVEEPKYDLEHSLNSSGQESLDAKELYISEPIVDTSTSEAAMPPDSNYMEMASFPPPAPSSKRKSVVLKNLEALQTYVSTTAAGEPAPKPGPSNTPSGPSTPIAAGRTSTPTPSTPPSRDRGGCKIYSRVGGSSSSLDGKVGSPSKGVKRGSSGGARDKQRPAMPFTNLKNFEQKHPKSAYVNTYIPAPEVPLPEPPKKEEGFFARLIRRNSKDKASSQSQENLNIQKNRTSIFERSMSEQGEAADEKANSKLKVGRRRSASFPNRLSFQETTGSSGSTANSPSKTDAPPPLPPSAKSSLSAKSSSSCARSSSSSSFRSSTKQAATVPQDPSSKSRQDNRSDNSSVHDLSDDSDMAPLLRHGSSSNSKSEMRVLTVLHVQQDLTLDPKANMCAELTPCSSSDPLFCKLSDLSSPKHSDSSFSLSGSSKTALSDSSKTDDEKLIDLFQCSKRQSVVSDIEDIKSKMGLPLEQQGMSPKEEAAAIARHVATIPPLIPPKSKKLPLSPVSEVSSTEGQLSATPSPPSPPQHPLLPSAPNQDEAIYVDMKELLPQPLRGPASPTAASQHPYNCPREQKERARATLRITPAVEDEEGNIWVPRHDAGEIRPPPLAMFEPPPPLPGLSPQLPPGFATQPSPRAGGEAPSYLFELRYTTPLVVSVDRLEGAGEGMAERLSLSSQGSCQSLRSFDDSVIRSSPAATVLRPRSGRDYQVVERRCVGSDSFSSTSAAHSPIQSTVFTYETCSLAHKSPASLSLSSWQSRERESSPGQVILTQPSTPSSLSRERTPPTPSSASLSLSKEPNPSPKLCASSEPPLPLPPRNFRMYSRAQSEPCSSRTESPRGASHSAKSSPPTTPHVPNSHLSAAPEMLEPMLNYAEIDLTSAAATPPPVELTRHLSRRHKKAPPKPVAIEYTQIDHTATTALKRAGQEHAQFREDNNSLRRGATIMSLARKNSAPATTKDRKGSSSFYRERKHSTCSVDSV